MDEVVVRSGTDHATLGADDARGHRLGEAEWIADGHDPIADVERVRVAEPRHRQVVPRGDLDQRNVGLLVDADELGVVLFAVRQLDANLVGHLHDMRVGDDVPILADDETGAQALLTLRLHLAEEVAEELVERVVGITHRPLRPHGARGEDVHHRGLGGTGDLGEGLGHHCHGRRGARVQRRGGGQQQGENEPGYGRMHGH